MQRYVALFLTAKEWRKREINATKGWLPFVGKAVLHFLTWFLSRLVSSSAKPFVFFILFLLFPFKLFRNVHFDWYWFHCSYNHHKKPKPQWSFKLALFTEKKEEALFLSVAKPVKVQEVLLLFLVQLQTFTGKVTIITIKYSFDLNTYLKGQLGSALKAFLFKPLAE